MKSFIIVGLLILSGCINKFKDNDIVLVVDSILGSTVHLATFNGNSYGKMEDCLLVAKLLSEKYIRPYQCVKYKDVKTSITK